MPSVISLATLCRGEVACSREVGPGFSCVSFAEGPLRRRSTKAEHRARLLQHPANRTQNLRRVPSQYKDKYEDDAEYHDGVEGC